MRRYSERWDGNVNRFLDNAQGTIPLGAFVRPTNTTPGEVEALNQDLVFLFEVADIGGVITVGELATGRKLSFTLLGQRDLSTNEKVALVGGLATPYVVVFVAKGGKWLLKSAQKADSVAHGTQIVDNFATKWGLGTAPVRITEKLSRESSDILRAEARDIWQATTGRRAIWDDLQVHHRIPLEWSHLFGRANPNRLSNLVGVDSATCTQISNAWAAWKRGLNGRTPTQAEVMEQALRIDKMYSGSWVFPK